MNREQKKQWLLTIIIFHLMLAVVTFGHRLNNEAFLPCVQARGVSGGVSIVMTLGFDSYFYWSWEIQRDKTKPIEECE